MSALQIMQTGVRGVLLVVLISVSSLPAWSAEQPNIIFILADDLGYGDLGSYGAMDIDTPNIDRLAAEGIRFTDHYTPANTCSPTRTALMTGRYQARAGVNAVIFYDSVEGMPSTEYTMAEMLRDAGYATGMVGKWHLGNLDEFMPWSQGFDEYFGVNTSNDDKNFFMYESSGTNYRRIPETVDQVQLTQRYNRYALDFIERHAHQAQPFFLYFAHTDPHIPLHPHPDFVGKSKRGTYGDVVMEVDDSVGQLLKQLDALAIADNTVVVFTSDNGGWRTMREWGGSNGVLREGKLTAFEGGHRVPALVRWPEKIPAGLVNQEVVTMMDWYVTFAHYVNAGLPDGLTMDGKSLHAVFEQSGQRDQTPFYYFSLRPPHENQTHLLSAVRDGKWKYKIAQRGYYPQVVEPLMKVGLYRHGELLFDLEADPGEQHNLIRQHPEVAQRLKQQIEDFNRNNPMPRPILIEAAPEDSGGWARLWWGIAQALILFVALVLLALYSLYKLARRYLRQ